LRRQTQQFKNNDELDTFLKKNFGYSYFKFADSLVQVYFIYKNIRYQRVIKRTLKKIRDIKKIKTDVLEVLDEFLIKYKFYNYVKGKYLSDKEEAVWTPEEKEKCIIKMFALDSFYKKLDRYTSLLKVNLKPRYPEIASIKARISPINLLALIWSYALRSRNRIQWGVMEEVLIYFWQLSEKLGIIDFLPHKSLNVPSAERLRFIYNKYRKTDYIRQAQVCFLLSFDDKFCKGGMGGKPFVREGKTIDYSDPIVWLNEYLWWDKEPEGWEKIYDLQFALEIVPEEEGKQRKNY